MFSHASVFYNVLIIYLFYNDIYLLAYKIAWWFNSLTINANKLLKVLHELLIRKQKRFVSARSTWSYLALIPSTRWTLNVERLTRVMSSSKILTSCLLLFTAFRTINHVCHIILIKSKDDVYYNRLWYLVRIIEKLLSLGPWWM